MGDTLGSEPRSVPSQLRHGGDGSAAASLTCPCRSTQGLMDWGSMSNPRRWMAGFRPRRPDVACPECSASPTVGTLWTC